MTLASFSRHLVSRYASTSVAKLVASSAEAKKPKLVGVARSAETLAPAY